MGNESSNSGVSRNFVHIEPSVGRKFFDTYVVCYTFSFGSLGHECKPGSWESGFLRRTGGLGTGCVGNSMSSRGGPESRASIPTGPVSGTTNYPSGHLRDGKQCVHLRRDSGGPLSDSLGPGTSLRRTVGPGPLRTFYREGRLGLGLKLGL